MKCFHHNDLDGRCAGYWVNKWAYRDDPYGEEPELFEIDYKDTFPMDKIRKNELVYIVDFSILPEQMTELLQITNNVVWIDHHESAIKRYKDFDTSQIRGIQKVGVAGCVLTYIYLFELTDRGRPGKQKKFEDAMITKVPMFTRLIGDRDIWAWVFEERTAKFCAGMLVYDTDPTSEIWEDAMKDTKPIEATGEVVLAYQHVHNQEMLKAYAFETEFEGHKCIACNVGRVSSQFFSDLANKYDIMMPFVFDGNVFTVSLYTVKGIDVSEIAEKYGGGGHKQAAGFNCKELPFKKIA